MGYLVIAYLIDKSIPHGRAPVGVRYWPDGGMHTFWLLDDEGESHGEKRRHLYDRIRMCISGWRSSGSFAGFKGC